MASTPTSPAKKAASNAAATHRHIQATRAEIAQLRVKPTGTDVQPQIKTRVSEFMASDRHDVAERRRFNKWFLSLEVRVTLLDVKFSR